jgi:predicted transcriptional regulator
VFALVTAIVTTQFSENYPLWQRVMLGVAVSILFLTALTVRELIFSLTAFRKETPVKKITMFAFGGVYQEYRHRIVSTHIPLLYLARFLSNLVIAAIFYGLYATFINAGNMAMAGLFQWLAYVFLLLFILHFIPAFPLDGGEILRMAMWRSTGDYYKATRTASMIGWVTGLFLIFAGVLVFIVIQQWTISLVIVLVGWTIQIAAGSSRSRIKKHAVLQNIKAEDIMTREYPAMSGQVSIQQLMRENILIKGWHYIIIVDGTKLKGILTIEQIKSVPWKRWNNTTAGDLMTPSDRLRTAHPQQTADTLFEEMDQGSFDYIPILEADNIVGVVTRSALMNLVRIRTEFGF